MMSHDVSGVRVQFGRSDRQEISLGCKRREQVGNAVDQIVLEFADGGVALAIEPHCLVRRLLVVGVKESVERKLERRTDAPAQIVRRRYRASKSLHCI
jgi:hypothetical protein